MGFLDLFWKSTVKYSVWYSEAGYAIHVLPGHEYDNTL